MQAPPPPLMPLLRSRLQAELLTVVLLTPGREWSLTELAERAGASVSSAQREMARAEDAGVVSSRRLGNTRLVSVANSPLTGPLTELLLRSFGPVRLSLRSWPGRWALRRLTYSVRGRPSMQDGRVVRQQTSTLLVIGEPDRDELDEAAQRAGSRLAPEVNVTVRPSRWWHEGGDGFHAEVTRRPLVAVFADMSAR